MQTLIGEGNVWALWAVLIIVAYFGIWGEKTKLGKKLSGVIISILGTFILSNLSIIPSSSGVYDSVWSYFVPFAIPLLLFNANLKKIFKEAGKTLIAFFFGTIGTVVGTIISFNLINLGNEGWKLASIFCSTYIGGSMNYVAAAEAVKINSGDLLTAGIAADNLVMTLYFLLLFAIPGMNFMIKIFGQNKDVKTNNTISIKPDNKTLTLETISLSIAISITICAIGYGLENLIEIKGSAILIITAITVSLATIFHSFFEKLKSADIIGIYLMQIFFATIGASANISTVINYGPVLFLFAAIILLIHLIILLLLGKIFKIDLRDLVIASNANMGGPTTAAAMAVGRKWDDLVIPAILCGTLGYAIATFIGVGLGFWLK